MSVGAKSDEQGRNLIIAISSFPQHLFSAEVLYGTLLLEVAVVVFTSQAGDTTFFEELPV